MKALSVENSMLKGELKLHSLFENVKNNASDMTAYAMEESIFKQLLGIGLAAMECYFAQKGTGDVGPTLDINGQPFEKENRLYKRDYFSIFGKFGVPRTCYRLEGYPGIMPLDAQADLPERCYSYLLQDMTDFLSIRDPYGQSFETFERFFDIGISASRFEVIAQAGCTSYDEFYEHKPPPLPETEGNIQVVQLDGKGVPIIKREAAELKARLGKGEKRLKKKEALVGVSYTIDEKKRTPEETAENLIYPEEARLKREEEGIEMDDAKARNVRRLASLERKKEDVVSEIVDDALSRDPNHEKPWILVMDGALALWSLVSRKLRGIDYVGVLDIIHVVEYLWLAGNTLHGENNPTTTRWVFERLVAILEGRVGNVIGGLKQSLTKRKLSKNKEKSLREVIRYFENHRQWMRYDEYLEAGYPIGSGVVESTCGQVKNRMEGTGRRWSIKGAESILLMRSVYMSGDWDEYWQAHMKRERILRNRCIFEGTGFPDDYDEDRDSDIYFYGLTGS